jgi:hypothetical protein
MDIQTVADQLEREVQSRNRRVRSAATREHLERAARLAILRMESGVESSGGDDALIDELQDQAISEEGVGGIGTLVATWILQSLFSWAIRRTIQIWRSR